MGNGMGKMRSTPMPQANFHSIQILCWEVFIYDKMTSQMLLDEANCLI
jgi:hypothetical protein